MSTSPEEFFDIVDETGIPTGQVVSREEAHRDKLWHRTTQIWIVNSNGEILCQKRSRFKDAHPGEWQSFFG